MNTSDRLIQAGCHVYKYEGQSQRFVGKRFDSIKLAEYLGVDSDEVEDELATVEYCVEDNRIQYYISFGCWDNVELHTDLGKKLIELLTTTTED